MLNFEILVCFQISIFFCVFYETFVAMQQREEKLKEHLKTALHAQKVASESYHKEKKARETFESLCKDLGEKCTESF